MPKYETLHRRYKYTGLPLDGWDYATVGNIIRKNGYANGAFRVEASAKAETIERPQIKSISYAFYNPDLFNYSNSHSPSIVGVIEGQSGGTVEIVHLSNSTDSDTLDSDPITVPVENGLFFTFEFAQSEGLFKAIYRSPDNQINAGRYFTKSNGDIDRFSTNRFSTPAPYQIIIPTDTKRFESSQELKQKNNTSAKFNINTNKKANNYLLMGKDENLTLDTAWNARRIITEENKNTEWTINYLAKNTTYYYQFWSVDLAGKIKKSRIKKFKTTNTASPKLIYSSPMNHDKNVPVNTRAIELQFDKPLDPQTVNKSNISFDFLLHSAGEGYGVLPIPAPLYDVSYNQQDKKIIIKTNANLEYNLNYGVIIHGVTDTEGNLFHPIYRFKTQLVPNSIESKLLSIKPTKNGKNIPLNSTIEATFNTEINPTETTNIFYVWAHNNNDYFTIEGRTTLSENKKLIFTPNQPLPPNSIVGVIGEFIFKDSSGNWIIKPKYWQFETVAN